MFDITKERVLSVAERDFNASFINIDYQVIEDLVWPGDESTPMWSYCLPASAKADPTHRQALIFLLTGIAQAFKFWHQLPDGDIAKYTHLGKSGTNAMFAGLAACWGDGFLSQDIQPDQVDNEFMLDLFGDIPQMADRIPIVQECLNSTLVDKCITYFLLKANQGVFTVDDAYWLSKTMPVSFGEDPYLKKAQLYCAAVAGILQEWCHPIVTLRLTAMADYQVPRVLRALNILTYSEELSRIIDQQQEIQADSLEERAIRSATVIACEAIAAAKGVSSDRVDHVLWSSQDVAKESAFHLTVTTNY